MLRRLFVSLAIIFLLLSVAVAQQVDYGNINGVVKDETDAVLPGVTVTISSPAMILPQKVTTTNERGFYRFPALTVGDYIVSFELSGFATVIREEIIVNIGKTTTLNITMKIATVAETITVTGESPVVDREKTTLGVNFSKDLLLNIPTERALGDIFNLTPGVTGSTSHGSDVRANTYNLDGTNIGDPVTGTPFVNFGYEIMEEVEVATGGHKAEFSNVKGAVINVVTKSGGNDFHGDEVIFFRNKDMQSDNTEGTPFEGQVVGFDREYDYTLSIGGPVMKDKLWFYANYHQLDQIEYVEGYVYDDGSSIPYQRKYPKFFAKGTYQINEKNKAVFQYNYSKYARDHRNASWQYTEDTTWIQRSRSNTYNGSITSIFSDNAFLTGRIAVVDYDFDLLAKNQIPRTYDTVTRLYSGSYGYDDMYIRNRVQANAALSYFKDEFYGKHEFKFGFEYERSWDQRTVRVNKDDDAVAAMGYDPSQYGIRYYTRDGEPYRVTVYYDYKRPDRKHMYGAFVQDTWSAADKLVLNLGLRFDRNEGIIPAGQKVEKEFKPIIWNSFSPRLGFAYDLLGDGKNVIRGGFSRYYTSNILQWFVTVNPNGWDYYYHRWYGGNDFGPDYYHYSQSAKSMDPDVRQAYTNEFTIGIEREIVRDFSVMANFIYRQERDLLEDVDITTYDLDTNEFYLWDPVTATDPLTGNTFTAYSRNPAAADPVFLVTNPEDADRDYRGFELIATKRMSNNWQMVMSYVYARSTGLIGTDFDDSWSGQDYYDNPNAHINARGRLEYERRHQFKIQGSYILPYDIIVSGYWRVLSGRRWTPETRVYGLEPTEYDIYVEERGSRGLPTLNYGDIRIEKSFNISKGKLGIMLEVFNLLNANTTTNIVELYGTRFEEAEAILGPRIARLAARFTF